MSDQQQRQEDKQGKDKRIWVTVQEEINGQRRTLREVPLQFKVFSSGSDGFYGSDKIPFENGERYQTSIILTRIGSKPKK